MDVSQEQNISTFIKAVKKYYVGNKRILPWREVIVPYHVLISEIMLQQTQVARVLVKFPIFVEHFPDFRTLAKASLSEILPVWKGMGYNRRALYLQRIAHIVVNDFGGKLPDNPEVIDSFPGIGRATARSIITFIHNTPHVFIETNIRRVFIHHFFQDKEGIDDREILPLVEKTLQYNNPRDWYYALMDYGSHLAKRVENPNRRSRHYLKQSTFKGSNRQIRGLILELLMKDVLGKNQLYHLLPFEHNDIEYALDSLKAEGFVMESSGVYTINSQR